jgi:hypothetical protein
MKIAKHCLAVAGIVAVIALTSCTRAERVPAFVKVGKTYLQDPKLNIVYTVLEIDPAGWIKVREGSKERWRNLGEIGMLIEVDQVK